MRVISGWKEHSDYSWYWYIVIDGLMFASFPWSRLLLLLRVPFEMNHLNAYSTEICLYKMFLVPTVFSCNLAVLAPIKAQLKVLSIQIILILSRQGWQIRFCLTLWLCLTYDILYCLVNGFSNWWIMIIHDNPQYIRGIIVPN